MSNEIAKGFNEFLNNPKGNVIKSRPVKTIKKIVAFIDMLGIANLMKDTTSKNATQIYEKLQGISELFKTHLQDFVSMEISDSFIIAASEKDLGKLIDKISLFQYDVLLQYQEIMRGGIAIDDIIDCEGNKIIGKAFIRAYELEDDNAIYPRVVVELRKALVDSLGSAIIKDIDGSYRIDFIERVAKLRGDISEDDKDKIITIVKQKAKEFKDSCKIKQKWEWLNTYLIKSLS
jgi:hypothetical protein